MSTASAAFPIGTPGTPWGDVERAEWLSRQTRQRSYESDVLSVVERLHSRFNVQEYGRLEYGLDVYAQFVKPYVKSNKNDRVDAAAICEAMGRPHMRFVPIKTVTQQDIQATHRIREELVGQRTAKSNQIRGLVGEYGIVAPAGIQQLRKALSGR